MATTDAMPVPIKSSAFRITWYWRLNTGATLSGAAGVAVNISKDGNTFAAGTNTPVEIATSSGFYYLDLTGPEMNADTVAVKISSSTTNALVQDVILYPQEAGNIKVDVQSIATSTTAATRQQLLADSAKNGTVDSATFTPTTTDFETSFTTNEPADFYKGRSLIFTTLALTDQVCRITGSTYTANSKIKLTVTALTAAPANGAGFVLC